MPSANIKRRATIERAYPPDAFASDAAQNGQTTNQVRLGVRILSAPNVAGDFKLERSSQHVGEAASPTFLAPHCKERGVSSEQPGLQTDITPPDPPDGYADFLSESRNSSPITTPMNGRAIASSSRPMPRMNTRLRRAIDAVGGDARAESCCYFVVQANFTPPGSVRPRTAPGFRSAPG
jgi:hypothetical protein